MFSNLNRVSLNSYVIVGHLLFLGLFVLSVIHFRERIIYADSAFQVFKWIQFSDFQFEAYRYSAVIPQMVVKLLQTLGAEISVLLKAASSTHIVVAWSIFTICAHLLKQNWIAVAIALAAVLCTRISFYGAVIEIHYLLSYPFLLLALLTRFSEKKPKGPLPFVVVIMVLVAVLLVHPLGFLFVLYICGFVLLTSTNNKKLPIATAASAVLWGLTGRLLFPPTNYEQGLYDAVFEGVGMLPQLTSLPSFQLLIDHSWALTPHFLPTWIIITATLILALRRKALILAVYVLSTCAGFLLLMIITYYEGESAIMLEKSFIPLATLISVPFLYEIMHLPLKWRNLILVPFALVLFIQIRGISFASRPMTDRYNALVVLVEESKDREVYKGIKAAHDLETAGILVQWALPFETILVSALLNPDNIVTVVSSDFADQIENGQLHPWFIDSQPQTEYFLIPQGSYVPID